MSYSMINNVKRVTLVLAVVAIAAGCGKKTEKPAAVAPTPDATAATQPAPAATPNAALPAVVVTDANQGLAETDAALKAKAYEKAVATLLAVQEQKTLTAQQAQEAANKMRALQGNLAAAVAAGDPNAIAAVRMLRQNH